MLCDTPILTKADRFAPLLEKKATVDDPSRVIVTASVAGLAVGTLGEHATFGYSASKAAVIVCTNLPPPPISTQPKLPSHCVQPPTDTFSQHLTKNLAVELGPRHILCNALAPGFFPSRMTNGLMEAMGGQEALAQEHPNRRLGRAEDIAAAVVFLSSRSGSHINGAVLPIDGGNHLVRGSKL